MTDLEIFSPQLESVGILDVYSSLVWERRYAESGYFEITAPATVEIISMLSAGNIVTKPGAVESGKIEQKYICDTENGATITVSGRFLSHLLYGHIVMAEKELSGNVEELMRQLVTDTVMDSSSVDYLPLLQLGELSGITAETTVYCNYPDLYEYLTAITASTGIMFRIRFDVIARTLIFECYGGVDRSANQMENPQIVFSEDDDTLSGAEYEYDRTAEINSVVARYYGDYGEVIVDYNPDNKTGEDKRTLSITGSCVTTNDSNGERVLDQTATESALLSAAKGRLIEVTDNFTASVIGDMPRYKIDYDIGDTVTVRHTEWGITVNKRIEKITETEDENGPSTIPTFGSPLPSIAAILKNKEAK